MTEFNLSDCLRCNNGTNKEHIRDIKQAVKLLKEEIRIRDCWKHFEFDEIVNKIFGDDLK